MSLYPQSPTIPTLSTPFHLRWTNGVILCHAEPPVRVQMYPWSDLMLTYPEACTDCVAIYRRGYHQHLATKAA
jgi:hypothetical protein